MNNATLPSEPYELTEPFMTTNNDYFRHFLSRQKKGWKGKNACRVLLVRRVALFFNQVGAEGLVDATFDC